LHPLPHLEHEQKFGVISVDFILFVSLTRPMLDAGWLLDNNG